MFFFFKHKNNQRQLKQNLEHKTLAQLWVNRCIGIQNNASSFLQAKSEKLSLASKRLIVIVFCLISFSSCVYLVIKSFFGNHPANLSIEAIRVPKQLTHNENRRIIPSKGVSKDEIEKIKKFRDYFDSLAKNNSGRRIYDSILKHRPGLIDSLSIIENLYKSQSSNK